MLPDIPAPEPNKSHFLRGRFLNLICNRILRQTPLAGKDVKRDETPNGLTLHATPGIVEADAITYGFKATRKNANELTITTGYVSGPDFVTFTQSDPAPSDWLYEVEVAQADYFVADGESVWLLVTTPLSTDNITGDLPVTDADEITVYSGAGGGGGQGGGGGSGGDLAIAGTAGAAGGDATGTAGGDGGDGAGGGGASPGEGDGEPSAGGDGGDGGAGGAGEVVTFAHYDTLKLRIRAYSHYTASLYVSSSKPSPTATEFYVRLASVSGSTITQHYAGSYVFTSPPITFIA